MATFNPGHGHNAATRTVRTQGVYLDARGALGVLKHLDYTDLSRKALKKAIRDEIKEARRETVIGLKSVVGTLGKNPSGDPRQTHKAVKMMVYSGGKRSDEGGNISILNGKKAKKFGIDRPARGGKSGITRKRPVSDDTRRTNAYRGADRAFILRFNNQGTDTRETKFGNRGKIPAGDFFGSISGRAMDKANVRLTSRIEKLIRQVAEEEG